VEKEGDLLRLLREMGHSDVHITKIYLQDYSGREAHKDHAAFSPILSIKSGKSRNDEKSDVLSP
jgi:hypothetical protein